MYQFNDLTSNAESYRLPSFAMTFNGQAIEASIPGYRTLNVRGRETISDVLQLVDIPARNGAIETGRRLPARILTIEYKMQAEASDALQDAFRQLRALLEGPGTIGFLDDPGIVYYGRLSDMSEVPSESNDVKGTFTMYCADPYKYMDPAQTKSGNPQTVVIECPYQIKPEEIKITLTAAVTKIILDNNTTGRSIILNGSFVNGDVVRIKPGAITKNNQNIMANLDYLTSDFGQFLVKNGDVLKVTPTTVLLTTVIRGRWK